MSRLTLLVCVTLLTFRVAAPASAEEQRSEAERLFEQAQACLAHGDFDLAVEFFDRSFLLSAEPVLVYDMAQAYRLKGDCEAALRQYQRFLRLTDGLPTADTIDEPRRLARDRMVDLGRQCGQPGQTEDAAFDKPTLAPPPQTAAPEPAVPPPAAPGVDSSGPVNKPGPGDVGVATSTGGDRGVVLRIAGIATFAVGVAGVATGVALNLKANSLASDLDASASTTNSSTTLYTRSKASSRSTYETLSWVGYGVGGACLAAGAVLYYLGHRRAGESTSVALLPVAGSGHVGAVVQGAF